MRSRREGSNGIWAAYPVAFLAMLTMQTLYYRLVWHKKQSMTYVLMLKISFLGCHLNFLMGEPMAKF